MKGVFVTLRAGIALVAFLPLRGGEPAPSLIEMAPLAVSTAAEFRDEAFPAFGTAWSADGDFLRQAPSLSEALTRLPGFSLGKRGAHAPEPILRGLSLDRVSTRFNGLPLFGSTPTQTGAPLQRFGPAALAGVRLETAFPSVTEGPLTTGGRITLNSFPLEHGAGGFVLLRGRANPAGWQGSWRASARAGAIQFAAALEGTRLDDYRAGDGRRVSAAHQSWNLGLAAEATWSERHALALALHHHREVLTRHSALPLDARDSPLLAATVHYRFAPGSPSEGGRWHLRLGFSHSEPFLTSEDRPLAASAPFLRITSQASVRSGFARLAYEYDPPEATGGFTFGLDREWWQRDARRTREGRDGRDLVDRIWPDVRNDDLGAFFERRGRIGRNGRWRLGARLDFLRAEARAPDAPVEGLPGARGTTVRENFLAFHGPTADPAPRRHVAGAVNSIFVWKLLSGVEAHGGIGHTVAPAGASERYRAFLPALGGGLELGNPALAPERKTELGVGLRWHAPAVEIEAEVFHAHIADFITREVLTLTPGGPLYSFRNGAARFHGGELSAVWRPGGERERGWRFPLRFAVVRGIRSEDRGRLPEIPPWNLSLGAEWKGGGRGWRLKTGFEAVATGPYRNPDPALATLYPDTPGHTLWHGELHLRAPSGWEFSLSLRNAFDRLAFAPLQPPVPPGPVGPAGGDLARGERVPEPGRSLILGVRRDF
jgi:iron complex outermembrane recepter protein